MATIYVPLLVLHTLAALVSPAVLSLRVWAAAGGRYRVRSRSSRVALAVDGALVLTGIVLAFTIGQWPFADSWLTAKVIGLAVYVVAGWPAAAGARPLPVRVAMWLLALASLSYVYGVSFTRDPALGVFSG